MQSQSLGRISLVLGYVVAQEMQLQHSAYCMKKPGIQQYSLCLLRKVFDHIDWITLMKILQNIRVDWRDKK